VTKEMGGSRAAAVATLLLLSPIIGEVLSGATRLSFIFALVPEIMVWGCGALLIRDLVRRWKAGFPGALLLGLGLAIAEELIIQQTSLAPLPWLGSTPAYGRALGVNWPYFLFMLGYEAVFIVLVPIQVTELIFPERRAEPWLRTRGLVASGVVFLVGSFIAWFIWTQQARPLVFHVPVYHPPAPTLALGALAITLLAVAASRVRQAPPNPVARAPRPWLAALAALLLGFPWYLLMVAVFAPRPDLPLWILLAAATAWALAAFLLLRRWSSATGWNDDHRFALCAGALVVCMLAGFLGASAWPPLDVVAKGVLNAIAVVAMAALGIRISRRRVA
jgi:hypothetical protein